MAMAVMKIRVCFYILCVCGLTLASRAGASEASRVTQSRLQTLMLSEVDRDAIGRVTFAEAGNQGDTGMAAVVHVILNRLASGKFGSSITQILNAKNQFEPATRAGGWDKLPALNPHQQARIDTIINLSIEGRLPDPTNGSLFFQNPTIVARREADGKVSKGLTRFNGAIPAAVIRDHEFYASINTNASVPVPVQAEKQPIPEAWDIYARARRQDLQENASWDVFAREQNRKN